MEETRNTKFLALQIGNINWKNHIKDLISELSGTCNAIGSVVHNGNINAFKSIYYANFHSVTKYGIIFVVTVGSFSLYKRKLSKLWLEHNPEPLVKVSLNN
jgi:hypothetical protein